MGKKKIKIYVSLSPSMHKSVPRKIHILTIFPRRKEWVKCQSANPSLSESSCETYFHLLSLRVQRQLTQLECLGEAKEKKRSRGSQKSALSYWMWKIGTFLRLLFQVNWRSIFFLAIQVHTALEKRKKHLSADCMALWYWKKMANPHTFFSRREKSGSIHTVSWYLSTLL